MKSCARKDALLAGALCTTIAMIVYGQYGMNFDRNNSPEIFSDTGWNYDNSDLWNITTVTSDELSSIQAEGPCSLRAAARQDVFLGRHFNFSVPVLQWAGSFQKTAWRRLSEHPPPYGWQGLPRGVVRSALAQLSDPSGGRLFERRSADQCVRCAVVGNGGILRGSGQGAAIDGHHYVFRVNGAVTVGFEEDVGTRTSFYGFTTNTMKHSLISYRAAGFTQVPQGEGTRYIFIPAQLRDYVMLAVAVQGRTVPVGEDKGDKTSMYFGSVSSAEQFKMLHPDFITYVTQRFLKSPLLRYVETRHLYMPSTGALMLLAALHTCDEVSAYGFITLNFADFSDHYYDRVAKPLRFYGNHDMQMEAWLWDLLDRRKVMTLYRRTGASS